MITWKATILPESLPADRQAFADQAFFCSIARADLPEWAHAGAFVPVEHEQEIQRNAEAAWAAMFEGAPFTARLVFELLDWTASIFDVWPAIRTDC